MLFNFVNPEEIMEREKTAVTNSIKSNRMPNPDGEIWTAICKFYPEASATKVDDVLSTVSLPKGWVVTKDPSDYYGRCTLILDAEGICVGSTFLKNTGYDYYGSTSFKSERLKELGVL